MHEATSLWCMCVYRHDCMQSHNKAAVISMLFFPGKDIVLKHMRTCNICYCEIFKLTQTLHEVYGKGWYHTFVRCLSYFVFIA